MLLSNLHCFKLHIFGEIHAFPGNGTHDLGLHTLLAVPCISDPCGVSSCHSHFSPDGCHESAWCCAHMSERVCAGVSLTEMQILDELDLRRARCSFVCNENIYWPGADELRKLKELLKTVHVTSALYINSH